MLDNIDWSKVNLIEDEEEYLRQTGQVRQDCTDCGRVNGKKRRSIDEEVDIQKKEEGRIVNGSIVPAHKYPWATIHRNGGSLCGSSLISRDKVLTAAHCVSRNNVTTRLVTLVLGCQQRSRTQTCLTRTVTQNNIFPHPEYNINRQIDNDIAVLRLVPPLTSCTSRINTICLPPANYVSDGQNGTVAGWGVTDARGRGGASDQLRETTMPIAPQSQCQQLNGRMFNETQKICTLANVTQSTDCSGDSGSCLFVPIGGRMTCVGAVSYGPFPCARYSVYARVSHFISWIMGI